jgi:hypothetical protein
MSIRFLIASPPLPDVHGERGTRSGWREPRSGLQPCTENWTVRREVRAAVPRASSTCRPHRLWLQPAAEDLNQKPVSQRLFLLLAEARSYLHCFSGISASDRSLSWFPHWVSCSSRSRFLPHAPHLAQGRGESTPRS